MLYFFAILAIAALSLSCWSFLMARNPKQWRLWWMTRMGIPDLKSSREQKRQQAFRLKVASYCFFILMLAATALCIWQVNKAIYDLRNKSPFDKTRENTQKEVEKYKGSFRKLK